MRQTRRVLLTDKFLKALKPAPTGKRVAIYDELTPSLQLLNHDTGHKSWIIHRRINGKPIRTLLGTYPTLGVGAARKLARDYLEDIAKGINPRQREAPITATRQRSGSLAGEIEKYLAAAVEGRVAKATAAERTRILRRKLAARWGTLPVAEIDAFKATEFLDDIAAAGKLVLANRTRTICGQFFKWARKRNPGLGNPFADTDRPHRETSRDRVLEDAELNEIWHAAPAVGWPFGPFVKALILTGARRGEIAGMTRAELDRKEHLWTLPAERVKNRRRHAVHITAALLQIVDNAPRLAKKDEDDAAWPIFATEPNTPVQGFSRAKRRLDGEILKARQKRIEDAGGDPSKARNDKSPSTDARQRVRRMRRMDNK